MAAILGDDIKSETPGSPKSFLTSKAAIFPPLHQLSNKIAISTVSINSPLQLGRQPRANMVKGSEVGARVEKGF